MRGALLAGLVVGGLLVTPSSGADTAPGLLVRLYDIGVDVAWLPELAPDQLPNVVKVVPTVDLHLGQKGFGEFEARFMTEVTGQLKVERAGAYRFRLISDDGAKLWIDNKLVIDHDGLHGAEPKDSAPVELTVGAHDLRILHFQGGGGADLRLESQATGAKAGAFELVPAAVLSHPADASMQTMPGTKKVIPPLRKGRPGDGTAVTRPHPGTDPKWTEWPDNSAITGELRSDVLPLMSFQKPTDDRFFLAWLPDDDGQSAYESAFVIHTERIRGEHIVQYGDTLPEDSDPFLYHVIVQAKAGESKRLVIQGVTPQRRGGRGLLRTQGCIFRYGAPAAGRRASGRAAFEILNIWGLRNGLEVQFTKPLNRRVGWDPESYYVEQWPFDVEEGIGLKRDGVVYPVKSASVSADRKKVFLEIPDLKRSHVVYLRLLPPCVSEDGELPWSTEAWYTLNAIPQDRVGEVLPPPAAKEPQNILTDEEKQQGFRLLFDGQTTKGWRGYQRKDFPDGWKVVDGCLVRVGSAGDIVTDEEFGDFELRIDWRISAGGNSGIMYRVAENLGGAPETGPEYQILDNAEHGDGRNPKTSAASCYALYAPVRDVTVPVGLFNRARIIARGNHVEHWLNDAKVVEYELNSPEWQKLVADSKFGSMPNFGRQPRGRIDLQDHGDKVWYRNIRIRALPGRD